MSKVKRTFGCLNSALIQECLGTALLLKWCTLNRNEFGVSLASFSIDSKKKLTIRSPRFAFIPHYQERPLALLLHCLHFLTPLSNCATKLILIARTHLACANCTHRAHFSRALQTFWSLPLVSTGWPTLRRAFADRRQGGQVLIVAPPLIQHLLHLEAVADRVARRISAQWYYWSRVASAPDWPLDYYWSLGRAWSAQWFIADRAPLVVALQAITDQRVAAPDQRGDAITDRCAARYAWSCFKTILLIVALLHLIRALERIPWSRPADAVVALPHRIRALGVLVVALPPRARLLPIGAYAPWSLSIMPDRYTHTLVAYGADRVASVSALLKLALIIAFATPWSRLPTCDRAPYTPLNGNHYSDLVWRAEQLGALDKYFR
jgi:hypothetical protein